MFARVFWEIAMWMLWCTERLLCGCQEVALVNWEVAMQLPGSSYVAPKVCYTVARVF